MFDSAQIAWGAGIQGILQAVAMTFLWIIAFLKLRFGAAGVFMGLMPCIGLVANLIVTLLIGRMSLAEENLVFAFVVIPNFVLFLFTVAPLVFLVLRLNSHREVGVFD